MNVWYEQECYDYSSIGQFLKLTPKQSFPSYTTGVYMKAIWTLYFT